MIYLTVMNVAESQITEEERAGGRSARHGSHSEVSLEDATFFFVYYILDCSMFIHLS